MLIASVVLYLLVTIAIGLWAALRVKNSRDYVVAGRSLPLAGVFATRSQDRPNPLGLHRVQILEIAGSKLKVGPLEAIDGTPIVDIKPVLAESADS